MQIICISRGSYSRGKELADRLAEKLGFQCVSREELLDEATRRGIPVGRIEMAMIKPHYMTERLLLAKEHYLALVTAFLCERALQSNIVYHGRGGHLVMQGVSHVLRIRVVSDLEYRIQAVMQRLNLSREKAKSYIEQVEEDRKRWMKHLYNVDWEEASHYDMVINLEQMTVENAAMALCSFSQLPDFQETPASRQVLEDLLLASRARMALAEDERTCDAQVKVRATSGMVSVTYLPQQSRLADVIPSVLQSLEGIRNLRCTMARTSILWIQERFDPSSIVFQHLLDIAEKWDAAIELLRFIPIEENQYVEVPDGAETFPLRTLDTLEMAPRQRREENGGIEDDIEESCDSDCGEKETLCDLIKVGRAGGGRCLKAPPKRILSGIDKGIQYSLIVVGDLFLSKGAHAQKRMCRELGGYLTEHIKCPVVMADELRTHYLFGKKQLVQMIVYFLIVLFMIVLTFQNQLPILRFFSNENFGMRVLSVGVLALVVPLFAYTYGTFSHLLCKLLKLE